MAIFYDEMVVGNVVIKSISEPASRKAPDNRSPSKRKHTKILRIIMMIVNYDIYILWWSVCMSVCLSRFCFFFLGPPPPLLGSFFPEFVFLIFCFFLLIWFFFKSCFYFFIFCTQINVVFWIHRWKNWTLHWTQIFLFLKVFVKERCMIEKMFDLK